MAFTLLLPRLRAQSEDIANATGSSGAAIPTDIPSITARFTEIDAQLETLRGHVQDVQEVVVKIQSLANATDKNMAMVKGNLGTVLALAGQNTGAIADVQERMGATAGRARQAAAKMDHVKGSLLSLEARVLELGESAVDVGKKVGDLEAAARELLPGKDDLSNRIGRARGTLRQYQVSMEGGQLKPLVTASIREHFLRATQRTEALAEDALREQMEATDDNV